MTGGNRPIAANGGAPFRPEFSGRSAWQVVAVSNRLTVERPDLGAELARAARDAFAVHTCHVLVGRLRKRERAQGIKDRVTRHDAKGGSPRA